jgi:uncharacterized protein (TIGR02118 family)
MIRVSILYPHSENVHFDWSYYVQRHMPLSIRLLSAHAGYSGVSVARGLSGASPGSKPDFVAECHYTFTGIDEFVAAFTPHASVLEGDISNYTNAPALIQFSEVIAL